MRNKHNQPPISQATSPFDDLPWENAPARSPSPGDFDAFGTPLGSGATASYDHEATNHESKKRKKSRRIKIGATVAGLATLASGGIFALKGGSDSHDAVGGSVSTPITQEINTGTTILAPEAPVEIPLTTFPEAPTATSAIEVASPVAENPSPFERTGDPAKHATLGWFEQANESIQVQPSTVELELDPAAGPAVGNVVAQEVKTELGAEFVVGFEHPSGLQVNVYTSTLDGRPPIEIDAHAMAILFSYVIEHAAEANTGYLNADELQKVATFDGGDKVLAGKRLDVVIMNDESGGAGTCLEDLRSFNSRPHSGANDPTKCDVAGFEYSEGETTYSIIVVQLQGLQPDLDSLEAQARLRQIGADRVLAHEFGHYVATQSGAHARHEQEASAGSGAVSVGGTIDLGQLGGNNSAIPDDSEHQLFVNAFGRMMGEASDINTDIIDSDSGPQSDGFMVVYPVGRAPFLVPPITVARV